MSVRTDGVPYWRNDITGEITYKNPKPTPEQAQALEAFVPFFKDFQEDYKVVPPTQPDFTNLQKFTGTSPKTNKQPVVGRPALDLRKALAKPYLDTQAPQGNKRPDRKSTRLNSSH